MKGKKLLSVTLAAFMTASSVGITAFADENAAVNTANGVVAANNEENGVQPLGATSSLADMTIQNFGAENNMKEGELHAEVMLLTLSNVNQTVNSVSVKLYHDDELLSTTTARSKFTDPAIYRDGISMTIITNGDAEISGSWETVMNTTDWYGKKPNKAVVNINGEEKTFENVEIRDGVDKYDKMEVAKEKVAEINGKTYSSLQKAVDAAQNGDTIKLTKDITVKLPDENITNDTRYYYAIINNKKLTIDFDGHTIKWDENYKNANAANVLFAIYNNADITITGNGTTIGWANGRTIEFWLRSEESSLNYLPSKLTVESGTFNGQQPFYVNEGNGNPGGEIIIKGGRIENIFTTEGHQQTLNVNGYLGFKENKRIVMQGGTLVHDDPRFVNDGNMVPDGYVVSKVKNADGKNEYTVIPESSAVASVLTATQDYDINHPGYATEFTAKYGYAFPTKVENYYTSLADAYANANAGDTITLTKDAEGDGIVIDKDITIDLNNNKYTVSGKAVGSTGYETSGFQLLAENVTFKNGTLTTAPTVTCKNNERGEYTDKAAMLIQNYANLNLDGVTLDGTNLRDTGYTLSNCKGDVEIKNSTIDTNGKTFAFDVDNSRGTNQTVEVVDSEIKGRVEISGNEGKSAKLVSGTNEYSADGWYIQNAGAFDKIESRAINVYAYGAENATTVYEGDAVTVDVKLDGNNIITAQYELSYDNTKFELTSTLGENELMTTNGTTTTIKSLNFSSGAALADDAALHSYAFKAIGQETEVTSAFTLNNVKASTAMEAVGAVIPATTNGSADITIALREYTTAITVDGTAPSAEELASKSKSVAFDGREHTFKVTTTPDANVKYKVNGVEVSEVKLKNEGVWTIEYTVENALGYGEVSGTFEITVGTADYVVEVDLTEDGDYVAKNTAENTTAKKIVLVYTNTDGLCFKYNNKSMIDVTAQGYKYNGTDTYDHVYAFVTDFVDNDLDTYKSKVTYSTNGTNAALDTALQYDINLRNGVEIDDIGTEYSVYNGYKGYFASLVYQANILKADTNKNKKVDSGDITDVTNAVREAEGFAVNR